MNTFRFTFRIATFVGCMALGIGLASPAHADAGQPLADDIVTTSETLAAIADVPGILSASDDVTTARDSDSAALSNLNGVTVDVPKDAADGIAMGVQGSPQITVTPPGAESAGDGVKVAPGVVAYAGTDGVSTAVQATTQGTRIVNVYANADAPSSSKFEVDVPGGGSIRLTESGGAEVLDGDGVPVLSVQPPWARDSAGMAVPTRYTTDGRSLTQHVDLDSPSIQFPVSADPWFWIALIERVSWTGDVLQVFPTTYGRYYAPLAARWAAWNEVGSKAPRARNNSMMNQFLCHWDLVRYRAPNKPSWNLDRNRPDVGYAKTAYHACNP